MSPALLALGAALSWSVSHVFVRLGSRNIRPLPGVVLSLSSSFVVLMVGLLVRGVVRPSMTAVLVFALAGVIGPGFGRFFVATAISKIGVTRTAPVQSAAQPIMTVLLGVFVLSEVVAISRLAGVVLTLGGVLAVVVSGQREAGRRNLDSHGAPVPLGLQGLRVLLWPIGAGSAFALSDLVRKQGMQIMNDVLFGASLGVAVALVIWGVVLVVRGEGPEFLRSVRTRDARWFMASGAASGVAQVFILAALLDGDLSMVGPIVSTQPIMTAIIARTFINKVEKVGLIVGMAAVLAAIGTYLISL